MCPHSVVVVFWHRPLPHSKAPTRKGNRHTVGRGKPKDGVRTVLKRAGGREIVEWPDGWVERGVEFQLGDKSFPVWIAVPADFFASAQPATQSYGTEGESGGESSEAADLARRSGTFDLLLEVELGVSISFGRAMVPLRDVSRLTSGSVVELNRTVSDPVEVIVNNCVIARGEVVVVEGNYGVRIQQIVSPRERLRTLH